MPGGSSPILPPVANAGPDQNVSTGATVSLNGSGSSDPDGGPSPLSYSWSQLSGPSVTLNNPNTATPTFTPGGTSTAARGTLHTIAIKASPHVSWRRTWMGGALAVGAFVVLVVGWMVMRALGIGPAGSLLGAGKLGAGDQIILVNVSGRGDKDIYTVAQAMGAEI